MRSRSCPDHCFPSVITLFVTCLEVTACLGNERTSGSSANLDRIVRVFGPRSDRGVGSEAGLRFGGGVSPAHVGGDRSVLFGVTAMIGAAQCEIPQCRELGLDPVQPRPVRRQKHQLDVVVRRPRPHCSFGEPACLGRDCQRRRFPAGDLVLTQGLEEFNYVTDEPLNLGIT